MKAIAIYQYTKALTLFCVFILISTFSFSQTSNTLPTTGNVGVGTMSPATKLEVVGDTKLGGTVRIDSTVVVKDSVTIEKRLTIQQDIKVVGKSVFVDDGKFKSNLKVLGTGQMKDKLVVDGLTRMNGDAKIFGDFKIKSLADPLFSSFTNQRLLTILPNGKVSVSTITIPQDDTFVCNPTMPWSFGTPTNADILLCPNFTSVTIGGNFTVGGLTRLGVTGIGTSANNQFELNIVSVNKTAGIRLLNLGTSSYGIQNVVTNDNTIAYSVTKSAGNQDVFVVMGDGRVGIGTDAVTDPGFMLTVEGAVRSREINVDATTIIWSDYVFDKDYKLCSLDEVENYIAENKHLPNVPSENEVKEEGINLGEMDAILLRKIEELTLYVIEQQKRIDELEKKIKN